MQSIKYDKLIRDKIPLIINNAGKKCVVEILSDELLIKKLNEKLLEEIQEYLQSEQIDELADVVEVIYAILDYKNVSFQQFERIRLDKYEKSGGFKDKLLLTEVIERA